MTLSTRIAVMDAGVFRQIGTPTEIYEFPESRFVADFIGSTNMLEGRVTETGPDHVDVDTDVGPIHIDQGMPVGDGAKVWIALRPEKIRLAKSGDGALGTVQVKGVVEEMGYFGDMSIYKVRVGGSLIEVLAPNRIRPRDRQHAIQWEDEVVLSWDDSSPVLLVR